MFNITVIGSTDRQLHDMLQTVGARVTAAPLSALAEVGSSRATPDLLFLDVRSIGAIPATLMGVKRQVPALGIVIVAKTMDPALLLDAMRAGVNEFVTDPITQEAVSRAVQHVVGQRAVAVDTGQVFAFVGAKGGVGTTTVAVNVATVLGGASAPGRSLFVDLHQASGDAAVFLGVEPRFSIAD